MSAKPESMVERMARAMLKSSGFDDCWTEDVETPDQTTVAIDGTADLLAVARAAILAMRDPTETMAQVGAEYCLDAFDNPRSDLAADAFRAMIDEALK